MEPGVELYCVAGRGNAGATPGRGVAAESVVVTESLSRGNSRPPWMRPRCASAFGLRDDLPVLLVLSGGFGLGPVRAIVEELGRLIRPAQLVVVCGRNEELRRELGVLDCRQPTRVLGFVTNMHELMSTADLVITKPGGLTTSEALAMGRPIFVLNPIPGQEAANSDFLLEHGAAAKANRVEDLPFRIEKLLGTVRLEDMARAARGLGRPDAAMAVCQEVLRRQAS